MPDTPMPRKDRLRRVVRLCSEFARNLAYYRVANEQEHRALCHPANGPAAHFWTTTINNFIDTCVLQWCKLFADPKEKHYWANIVTDPTAFKAALLVHLGIEDKAFQDLIQGVRRYRDKFLAHLDSDYVMNVPVLDDALKAASFYHRHVIDHEADPGDLTGLALDLDKGYKEEQRIAESVYRRCR